MSSRPTVFIGSSSEGLDIAEAVQALLDNDCEVTVWTQGVFLLGLSNLENLTRKLGQYDFAVLVLTPDDLVKSRGVEQAAGRDNVIFELGLFMGMTLVYAVVASVGSFLTQGPMQCGFHIVCMKKIVRGRTEIGDLFLGFNFFVPALLAALVIGLLGFIGFLLCIIPGLVIASMYKFTYLFIVDKRMDFWPAMQASHSVVKNDYVGFVLFLLGLVGLNIIGFCCLLIGLLITVPISFMAITIAYRELVGFEPNTV